MHLLPLADVTVVPSIFPEAFGMVAAEAAAAGSPPLVARHSGLAEVAAGLEESYPERFRGLASFDDGRRDRPRAQAERRSSRSPPPTTTSSARGASGRRRPLVVDERRAAAARSRSDAARLRSRRWARSNGSPGRSCSRQSRAAFDAGTDLTVAVEEEFALLDPDSLELTDRFEELYAAAIETDLAPNVVGELIASEIEVRTGKCADFGEAAAAMAERRGQLHAVARELSIGLGGTATHPWSRWQDQRIIDTPHYRRNDELLRYVVWRNNTFGLHVHVGIAGADRAIAVHDALRNFLPELLALSASSPFVENVNTGLHSARTEIFTRMFPRCGIPDPYGDWQGWEDYVAFLYRPGRSPSTRRSGGASGRISRIRPSRSASATASPISPRRSRSRRSVTRSPRAARARYDEGEPLPDLPHRLLEENLWRAIRYGLSGELIDFERGEPIPARARLEQLLDWVAPGRRRDRRGAVSRGPGAERRRAPDRARRRGRDLRRDLRRAGAGGRTGQWLTRSTRRRSPTSCGVRRRPVPRRGSLDPGEPRVRQARGRRPGQARQAIDTLAALLPLVESGLSATWSGR